MKVNSLMGFGMLLLVASCTKSNVGSDAQGSENRNAVVSSNALLADPLNCTPSLFQSNANAFQYNFAKMKLTNGMTGLLTQTTPAGSANHYMHVYLKTADGKYHHLPCYSPGNVPYSYSVKAVFPHSVLSISRPSGVAETFETIIVLGVNAAYVHSLGAALNFDDYGAVKTKLGF